MTPNVCFALLDQSVIAGRGEQPVVVTEQRTWTHARLLEEVAALGGVLRHLGIEPGTPCVVALDDDTDAVVAALAVARLGGVVTLPQPEHEPEHEPPVAVVSAGSEIRAGVRLVRGAGEPVAEPDLDWVVMLRAGRTDPAPCEVLEPGSAYSLDRTVAEQITLLQGSQAPFDAADLRALLQV